MAVQQFRLPDPGEGLVEAEIVTWRVAVGDSVEINDILLEVETSKSLVELPSPYAGTVSALLVAEGDTVDVGSPIISIDDGAASSPAAPTATGTAKEDLVPAVPEPEVTSQDSASGGRVAVLVGYGPRTTEAKRRPRKGARAEGSAVEGSATEAHDQAASTFAVDQPVSRRADDQRPLPPDLDEPVGAPLPSPGVVAGETESVHPTALAKPPVRKLAKDLGVDLRAVSGTGPGGVITREDVTSFAESVEVRPSTGSGHGAAGSGHGTAGSGHGTAGSEDLSTGSGHESRIPIKGVRKATAAAMVRSAFTAPHVTEWVTLDVTATVELVERLRARREFRDVRVTPLLIIAKAALLALRRTPELNAHWDADAGEIVIKHAVNLGIAAATPRGLLVPNVKGASALGLAELATALQDLVATARAGRTQPADTAGGTFTITNVGVFGIDAGTPILNPGETGILCVGQIARRPWVVGTGAEERIEPRSVMTLSVSFDHRVVDGEQGSRFLSDVAAVLSDPGLSLLY